jgi:hypothetical protein
MKSQLHASELLHGVLFLHNKWSYAVLSSKWNELNWLKWISGRAYRHRYIVLYTCTTFCCYKYRDLYQRSTWQSAYMQLHNNWRFERVAVKYLHHRISLARHRIKLQFKDWNHAKTKAFRVCYLIKAFPERIFYLMHLKWRSDRNRMSVCLVKAELELDCRDFYSCLQPNAIGCCL